jgi:hypothetical protein
VEDSKFEEGVVQVPSGPGLDGELDKWPLALQRKNMSTVAYKKR